MALYNVDFFTYDRVDRALKNVHHDAVEDPTVDDDYISINTSTISILPTDNIEYGQYIYISGRYTFLGFVTGVSTVNGYTNVTFKPFIAQFDEEVFFNVKHQGRGTVSLEDDIWNMFRRYYIYAQTSDTTYCRDPLQCLPLVIEKTSNTMYWGFNLKPDVEGKNWCKCGFYSVILVGAMKKYGIAVNVTPNFHRTVTINGLTYYGVFELTIGKIVNDQGTPTVYHIDAELPGTEITELQLDEKLSVVNKLQVINTEDYLLDNSRVYYVHPPDSTHSEKYYDRNNVNRITPVVRQLEYVTPDDETTFAEAADEAAYSALSGLDWSNLVELEVYMNNRLVNPIEMKKGQMVAIHYRGGTCTSMLTGKRYGTAVTLTFGSERILFTKQR